MERRKSGELSGVGCRVEGGGLPTLATEKSRKDGARELVLELRAALVEVEDDGGVVGGFVFGAGRAVDEAGTNARGQGRRDEEVVDADAAVVVEGGAKVVPVGELAGFAGVEGAEGVGVAEGEPVAVALARFGLEEGVADPGCGFVAVDVFGDDVVVAADEGGDAVGEPAVEADKEAVHPGEFVGELLGADGVAVGEVDVDDAQAGDVGFKEAGVAIRLVSGEGGGGEFDGSAGEDGDAVVGFLSNGDRVVAKGLEDFGGEDFALELLHEEDVGGLAVEPALDVLDAGANGVDVPACDFQGRVPGCSDLRSRVHRKRRNGCSRQF
jgi:hypothetical protein